MNNWTGIGRLTGDPQLKYLPSGNNTAVARFTIAIDRQLSRDKKAELEKKNQPTADFINIIAWGKQAENCNNNLAKGRLVAVSGRIQTGSYEGKDGKRVYTTDVVADRVQFLEWANSNENKASYADTDIGDGFYTVDNEDIPF